MLERTFVLIKPDGVKKKVIGQIITIFEKAGLKIEDLKMVHANLEIVSQLYPLQEEWLKTAGQKLLHVCDNYDIDIVVGLGTNNALELGKIIRTWQIDFLTSGQMVAMVLSGNRAIEAVRKLIGDTSPLSAYPGTIRGDFSIDSIEFANFFEKRAVYNIIHASSTSKEAEYEISLWFSEYIP